MATSVTTSDSSTRLANRARETRPQGLEHGEVPPSLQRRHVEERGHNDDGHRPHQPSGVVDGCRGRLQLTRRWQRRPASGERATSPARHLAGHPLGHHGRDERLALGRHLLRTGQWHVGHRHPTDQRAIGHRAHDVEGPIAQRHCRAHRLLQPDVGHHLPRSVDPVPTGDLRIAEPSRHDAGHIDGG